MKRSIKSVMETGSRRYGRLHQNGSAELIGFPVAVAVYAALEAALKPTQRLMGLMGYDKGSEAAFIIALLAFCVVMTPITVISVIACMKLPHLYYGLISEKTYEKIAENRKRRAENRKKTAKLRGFLLVLLLCAVFAFVVSAAKGYFAEALMIFGGAAAFILVVYLCVTLFKDGFRTVVYIGGGVALPMAVIVILMAAIPCGYFAAKGIGRISPDLRYYYYYKYELSEDGESAVFVKHDRSDGQPFEIRPEYKGKPVTEIAEEACQYDYSITELVIPDGVVTIKSHAFAHCQQITSVFIPASVEHIAGDAFWGDDSVETFTVYSMTANLLPPGGKGKCRVYCFRDSKTAENCRNNNIGCNYLD